MLDGIVPSRLPASVAALLIALSPCGTSSAADVRDAAVEVAYRNPESYTDFGDGYATPDSRRTVMLDEVRRHIQRTAAALVPRGSTLRISIADIDMAGAFEPLRGARYDRVRTFREVYPPRIRLEFMLVSAAGGVLKEGTRDLTDLVYLTGAVEHRSDVLRYEKKLLSDWLARELSRSEPH